jgi:(p)ppGpp synthase/HD superfamily hydrolase
MNNKENWEEKFMLCSYANKLLNLLYGIKKQQKNPIDIQQVKKAIYYARKYHGSQLRKSGDPYYSHPIEVAYLFSEYASKENIKYFTTDLIITAILHDTIEDTDLTKEMIAELFNQSVADNVEGLTRVKFDKKISAGETLNLLFEQHKKDILYIKLFDRLHNIRTIKYMKPEKIKKIIDETIDYFIPFSYYLEIPKIAQEIKSTCSDARKLI